MRRPRLFAGLLAVLVAALAACTTPEIHGRLVGTLVIYASPSLAEPFDALANAFETAYPGVDVQVSYGPDTEIATRSPAPDIIAVEGASPLAGLTTTGEPLRFASNQLVLAVRPDSLAIASGLADLGRADLRVLLCASEQPCGQATDQLLSIAGVTAAAAQRTTDTRAILAAIADGTADLGLVYRSDVRLAGVVPDSTPTPDASASADGELPGTGQDYADEVDTVVAVELVQSREALTTYHAAVLAGTTNLTAAQSFLDYLGSEPVLAALTGFGFQAPQP